MLCAAPRYRSGSASPPRNRESDDAVELVLGVAPPQRQCLTVQVDEYQVQNREPLLAVNEEPYAASYVVVHERSQEVRVGVAHALPRARIPFSQPELRHEIINEGADILGRPGELALLVVDIVGPALE